MNLNFTQKELLNRWLNAEADESDIAAIKNDPELLEYIQISQAASHLATPEYELEKAYEKLIAKRNQPQKVYKLFTFQKVYRYAAILIALVGVYYFFQTRPSVIEVAYAQQSEIVLPDASEVLINAGSKLSYQKNNWNKKRLIHLEGEAYFKVSKGGKFTVQTSLGNVQVVGTQFNVNQRENLFEVECYQGKVDVSHGREIIRLTPGKCVKLSTDGTLVLSSIVAKAPFWTTGVSNFENESLQIVLDELKRQYNLQIDVDSTVSLDQRFTGSFKRGNLDLALKTICLPLKLTYRFIADKKVVLHAEN
ncbi:MAG: histidine kinase [Flavobacteriales bacterium CG_4_9_14_3_um_filter_40_17]|nr:MAG: histidine kinase [Flavobacteriales bacterium CG_4_9_14_3_um_filter_40_17]